MPSSKIFSVSFTVELHLRWCVSSFPLFFVCGLIVACNERGQRSQVKTMHISAQAAEAVVEAHVKMYVLTVGAHNSSGG